MSKPMKIENLKNYDIPPYIVDIWKKHYSHYLLPLQEEAVRKYNVLGYGKGSDEIASLSSKTRNDRKYSPLLYNSSPIGEEKRKKNGEFKIVRKEEMDGNRNCTGFDSQSGFPYRLVNITHLPY